MTRMMRTMDEQPWTEHVRNLLRGASARVLLLDYDGTLVPLAPVPKMALPDADLIDLLGALARLPGTQVHVVSGRSRECLQEWLGGLPVGLHAEHGFWSRVVGGQWQANGPGVPGWKPEVLTVMRAHVRQAAGTLIEEKTTAVAFHYRVLAPAVAHEVVSRLKVSLLPLVARAPLELLEGSRVLEVRPRGIHKGHAVMRVLGTPSFSSGATMLAAGDDVTDEDLFRALPSDALSIKIGMVPSRARWRLERPADLRTLLRSFLT